MFYLKKEKKVVPSYKSSYLAHEYKRLRTKQSCKKVKKLKADIRKKHV